MEAGVLPSLMGKVRSPEPTSQSEGEEPEYNQACLRRQAEIMKRKRESHNRITVGSAAELAYSRDNSVHHNPGYMFSSVHTDESTKEPPNLNESSISKIPESDIKQKFVYFYDHQSKLQTLNNTMTSMKGDTN